MLIVASYKSYQLRKSTKVNTDTVGHFESNYVCQGVISDDVRWLIKQSQGLIALCRELLLEEC